MKEPQKLVTPISFKLDSIHNICQLFSHVINQCSSNSINLRNLVKVENYPYSHVLYNNSMQKFGDKMYFYYYQDYNFFRHEYDRVHQFPFYNTADPIEKVLAALFNVAYHSLSDLLNCTEIKCDTDLAQNGIIKGEILEIDKCSNIEFYKQNKKFYDEKINYIQETMQNALELENIIQSFLKKFIIEYRKEGLYLDERCIDMTKDIDVIQYLRRVYVEPQEFFIWAEKQNFPLPKDVHSWLEIKQQQAEEKNIKEREQAEKLRGIEKQKDREDLKIILKQQSTETLQCIETLHQTSHKQYIETQDRVLEEQRAWEHQRTEDMQRTEEQRRVFERQCIEELKTMLKQHGAEYLQCIKALQCLWDQQRAEALQDKEQGHIKDNVDSNLSEEELKLEEEKKQLSFEEKKKHLLTLATGLRKNQPEGSKEWKILRVGELGLKGHGHDTILKMEPKIFFNQKTKAPYERHWVRNRRSEFIRLIQLRYNIDPTPFFPE